MKIFIAMYNLYIMKTNPTLARTQIYLTQSQQTRLQAASRRASLTKSELIRQAVDQFLERQSISAPADKLQRLKHIEGLWADRDDLDDPSAYVQQLRKPRF